MQIFFDLKTTTNLFIFLTFFGIFSLITAQESKNILELKAKLSLAKTDDEKINANRKILSAYYKIGNVDSALVYSKQVLSIFQKKGDKQEQGKFHLVIGELYMMKADFNSLEQHLNQGARFLEDSQNYDDKALLNHMYAAFNMYKKNYSQAADYFKKNIQYYQQGKKVNNFFVMHAYRGLFSNSFIQSKFGETYELSNSYLDFMKKNSPEKMNEAYMTLGSFYSSTKNMDKAIEYFKKSSATTDKKNLSFINTINILLGISYEENKNLDSAKYYLDTAYDFFKDKNNAQSLAMIYYGYALINKQKENYEQAEEEIQKAISLVPSQDLMSSKFMYQSTLNDIQLAKLLAKSDNSNHKNELENVLKNLKEEEKFIKTSNSILLPNSITQNLKNLYKVNEQLGNYEEALSYHKKYIEANEKIYGLDNMRGLSNAESDYELREQKAKIELQEQSKRLQLQKEIELKALRYEYEKKQAAAKTEEERRRLKLEEDLKRKEIEITYEQQQKALAQKYQQERQLAKINQEKKDAIAKAELESSKTQKNMWAIGAGLSLLLLGFAGFSYNQKRRDNQKIAQEKQKSDDLLLNILPHEVAEELKEKGETSAKHYDEVSVLFTDFVNFTANSEKLGVQEVLNELNICFTAFDKIMEKFGLEKIKTIGDAYLAVSGLPVSNTEHAKNAVNAGLEILKFIEKRKLENPNALDIRIGIHSGPVIAGIVGVKKFAYDIWGDTVNTAARMEQNSQKGKLNISGSTFDLVKNDFHCEHRGKIETKGKGALDMYFVS